MNKIRKQLSHSNQIAVWGLGYLGYTEILNLQRFGFKIAVWDYIPERFSNFVNGQYPTKEMCSTWSMAGNIPTPDFDKIARNTTIDDLLTCDLHFICLPNEAGLSVHEKLKETIISHNISLQGKYFIFVSACTPGTIKSVYLNFFAKTGAKIATAFRQDWFYEEMAAAECRRILAASNTETLNEINAFFSSINSKTICLPSFEAAEIMVHAENVLHSLVGTYLNELAMAFPDVNIQQVTASMLGHYRPRLTVPALGNFDTRQISSLKHLGLTDRASAMLTLLGSISNSSLSILLRYCEIIQSMQVKKVAIIGISSTQSTPRDVASSPGCLIAEYLHKQKIDIEVYAPMFTNAELQSFLPFASVYVPTQKLSADAVIILNDVQTIRCYGCGELERLGWFNLKLIIDNPGMLRYMEFPKNVKYHIPGDGTLGTLWG